LKCITLAAGFIFFLRVQKEAKKTPVKDYIPFIGWFPDLASMLL
jgi:hypothetical protein